VRAPDQTALAHSMFAALDDEIAAEARAGYGGPYPFEGTLVGATGTWWFYDFPLPHRATLGDVPVQVHATDLADGWLTAVGDGSGTVALDADLGDRVDGWVDIDNAAPLRALRHRLEALASRSRDRTGSFRFDQASLVLGSPGGRLRDAIARMGGSSDERFDAGQAEVLSTALRHRWAIVSPPAGTVTTMLARLLDRLLAADATVLLVSPRSATVDAALLALCDRLRPRRRLSSGLVQRVGPIGLAALRERHGELIDARLVAADLRSTIDSEAVALDDAELHLRYEQAERRYAETEELYEQLSERLSRAGGRSRLGRLRGGENPDELRVAMHQLQPQRRAAQQAVDRIGSELARSAAVASLPPPRAGTDHKRPFPERLREIADARERLAYSRAVLEEALRQRCRLVATITGLAYVSELPRESYDVVVVAGQVSRPEAFYLGGLSTRSVVAVDAPRLGQVHRVGTTSGSPEPPAPRGDDTGRARRERDRASYRSAATSYQPEWPDAGSAYQG
jgi:hypothetical protein